MNTKYAPGISNLHFADALLLNKKIGLVTNYTAIDNYFKPTSVILHEKYGLTRLFAPEHGIYGVMQAGDKVSDEKDKVTGLPVISFYSKKGDMTLFDGLDVICYDIQDIGLRFYTYISMLTEAMKLCKAKNIPIVVFDRYCPLGLKKTGGTMLEKQFSSFIGVCSMPSRYALTVGEFARFANDALEIHCDLTVIPCEGLIGSDDAETLSVPWVHPSPNIPTFRTALVYAGTVVFEGSNVSEGRGTTKPFELIGAPWIDAEKLADKVNKTNPSGVHVCPAYFTPTFSKYKGEVCNGIQIHITDKEKFEPCAFGIRLIDLIRNEYSDFQILKSLKLILGKDDFEKDGFDVDEFLAKEKEKTDSFLENVKQYLIYDRRS